MDYTQFGVGMIVLGIIFFVIELTAPGFYIAIPATMLIVLGTMAIILQENMDSPWVAVVSIVLLIAVLYGTMQFYKSLAPPEMTDLTIMGLSLKGKYGKVIKEVNDEDNTGQIRIMDTTNSYRARSREEDKIPVGNFVEVLDYQGITLIVKPVDKDKINIESKNPNDTDIANDNK